jgi:hypothetical protein
MNKPTYNCRLLKTEPVAVLTKISPQPICNRFLSDPSEEELLHPFTIGQCQTSGLLQLCDPVSAGELIPSYDWITYSEPEDHLDDMVEAICRLPGISENSIFCGLTFKDDSTLDRLRNRKYNRTWTVDPREDLQIDNKGAGAETIQERFTPEAARQVIERRGDLADIAIVRHVLEHAHDTLAFMKGVRQLVKPGGYVLFEVPDCTRALESLDYTTLWEEHVLYFTEETFRNCFSTAGLELVFFESYPYVFENSLVGIAKVSAEVEAVFPKPQALEKELERGQRFISQLAERKNKIDEYLAEFRRSTGKIALFGAGHLACAFINILGISDHFEFVVDDNPHKKGLYMPGSGLPIQSSQTLIDEDIKLCLLSLNPLSEDKVIANNRRFVENGGVFASIFPASKRAFLT